MTSQFKENLIPFLEWVKFNQLTVNWDKTKFMLLTRTKNTVKHKDIYIDNKPVEVVETFKLLGVTIDNNLSFQHHVKYIKSLVNKKLFALKKVSFLSTLVKIQFFKSFILPHFDYCAALIIFFNKKLIDSLERYFNFCLYRLFNFKLFSLNLFEQKIFLKKFNILPMKLRFLFKFGTFIYKILDNSYYVNLS